MEVVANLLRAPYPLEHPHYKRIYVKSGALSGYSLYTCNCCRIKLLGEKELLEHNGQIGHEASMERIISDMLNNATQNCEYDVIVHE